MKIFKVLIFLKYLNWGFTLVFSYNMMMRKYRKENYIMSNFLKFDEFHILKTIKTNVFIKKNYNYI